MTSFSFKNKSHLPGHSSTLDRVEHLKQAFNEDRTTPAQGRGSSMVAKDQPHPVPRPSPDMAYQTDRTSFNTRWSAEIDKTEKAAFKARRQETHQRKSHIIERTDVKTGAQVRVFNKCNR